MNAWPFGDLSPFSFDLIMADFPWCFDTWSGAGKNEKSPEKHYKTMSLDQIKAMPIGHLGARDCLYWIWATHPMLPLQLSCLKPWGLKYVTSGVWVKYVLNKKDPKARNLSFGTGYRLRCASEPFIIATNGNPKTARTVRTVVMGPLREHSRKPEEAYAAAEEMIGPGARKLDMFSRQPRAGWQQFGDESDKFPVAEAAE